MDLSLETAMLAFPGLVALAVYRGVRDRRREDGPFIQAAFVLGFTLLGGLVAGEALGYPTKGEHLTGWHLLVSLVVVVAAAVGTAAAANHEWLYKAGAWMQLTKRAGEHPPWDQIFRNQKAGWVRVRFKDDRVLVGAWSWASLGDERLQLFIANAVWNIGGEDKEVLGDGVLLPNMDDVLAIDFLDGAGGTHE